jgi:hypothetical protein
MRATPLLFLAACGSLELDTISSEVGSPPADHLALWLDASRGVGLYPDGEVYRWDDQSGHGHVLGRGSPDSPSIRVAKFPGTGQLGLLFQPDDSGHRGYLVNSAFALEPPMTIAMVFHPLPTPQEHWDTPLGGLRAPTIALTKRVEWSPIPQTTDLAATTGYQSSFQYISARDGWGFGTTNIAVARFAGPDSSIVVDNDCTSPPLVPCGSGQGALGGDALDGIVLSHGGDRTYHGYIAEILIYDTALDRIATAELSQYLHDRYD